MIVICILLFLYASYLTLEKYIVTGYVFRIRYPPSEPLLEDDVADSVPNPVGDSRQVFGHSATAQDSIGQAASTAEDLVTLAPQQVQSIHPNSSPATVIPSTSVGRSDQIEALRQLSVQDIDSSHYVAWQNAGLGESDKDSFHRRTLYDYPAGNDFPERDEVVNYTPRHNIRQTGVTLEEMDSISEALSGDTISPDKQEQARRAFRHLEGTDMERILRASILGSSAKLKHYMDLYVGISEGRVLTRKTKESILGVFDIEEYV